MPGLLGESNSSNSRSPDEAMRLDSRVMCMFSSVVSPGRVCLPATRRETGSGMSDEMKTDNGQFSNLTLAGTF